METFAHVDPIKLNISLFSTVSRATSDFRLT